MRQLRSFGAAFCGIWHTIKNEGHFRFHLVAAFYVIIFGLFYDFSRAQWTLILLLIGAILAAELFNTALENLADRVTKERDALIKVAKDAAAGAVLALSAFAVVIAVMLYLDFGRIANIFSFFLGNIPLLILLIISIIISIVFIVPGPEGIAKLFRKTK